MNGIEFLKSLPKEVRESQVEGATAGFSALEGTVDVQSLKEKVSKFLEKIYTSDDYFEKMSAFYDQNYTSEELEEVSLILNSEVFLRHLDKTRKNKGVLTSLEAEVLEEAGFTTEYLLGVIDDFRLPPQDVRDMKNPMSLHNSDMNEELRNLQEAFHSVSLTDKPQ